LQADPAAIDIVAPAAIEADAETAGKRHQVILGAEIVAEHAHQRQPEAAGGLRNYRNEPQQGERGNLWRQTSKAPYKRGNERNPRQVICAENRLRQLGCPKALVDSERIITKLRSEGYELSPSYQGADAVVVNTCGLLDSAKADPLPPSARPWPRTAR
jgi:hypothetical protein